MNVSKERGHDELAHVRALIDQGDPLLAYDLATSPACDGLDDDGALRLGYLRALALARSGASRGAATELAALAGRSAGVDPKLAEDMAALGARLVKDDALSRSGEARRSGLVVAARRYEEVFGRHRRPYSGVNAASLYRVTGHEEMAFRLAAETESLLDADKVQDYWSCVTRAEVALIRADASDANRWLGLADQLAPEDFGARASTLRQLRMLCAAVEVDSAVALAPLTNPGVVHYCGHRILAPGESGRFPATEEHATRDAVERALSSRRVGFAFGSLAAGADVIIAEAVLASGAELHAMLPFSEAEFVATSVRPSGETWVERFEHCLHQARSVTVTCDSAYGGDDELYGHAARVAMGQARIRASSLASEVWQLAVWDGFPTGLDAGTAHDVEVWAGAGGSTTVIPLTAEVERGSVVGSNPTRRRPVRAMLFGDLGGFSSLRDEHIAGYVDVVLGAMAGVLDRYGASVIDQNTWGDGLFVAVDDVSSAAMLALELQRAIEGLDAEAAGLPILRLRMSAHAGPVLTCDDPVRRTRTIFGREITRAARIEPRTPVGEVYATESFAALLGLDPDAAVVPEYVGRVTTAKDFETIPMYVLTEPLRLPT